MLVRNQIARAFACIFNIRESSDKLHLFPVPDFEREIPGFPFIENKHTLKVLKYINSTKLNA